MRKIIFLIMAAVTVASMSVSLAAHDPNFRYQEKSIQDYLVMQEIDRLSAANPWIVDINLLQPGQSVRIPIDSVNVWMVSVDKWRKVHGTSCLWDIARARLDGSLEPDWDVTRSLEPTPVAVPPSTIRAEHADLIDLLGWLCILVLISVLVVTAWLYLVRRGNYTLADGHPRWAYAPDDSRRYPPVVRGGLVGTSPLLWGAQISQSHPELNRLGQPTVVRGILVSTNGQSRTTVEVETGETQKSGARMTRMLRIMNNQEAAQATYPNGEVHYFSWGCVNGLVGGQHLGLPEGWIFVANQGQQVATSTVIPPVVAASTASPLAPAESQSEAAAVVPASEAPVARLEVVSVTREFTGPALRFSRAKAENGSQSDQWTVEATGDNSPIDHVVVGAGETGNGVEVHFYRQPVKK